MHHQQMFLLADHGSHTTGSGVLHGGSNVLKSQISTIPEEEMDQEYGNGLHTDQQSNSNLNGTMTNFQL